MTLDIDGFGFLCHFIVVELSQGVQGAPNGGAINRTDSCIAPYWKRLRGYLEYCTLFHF